MPGGNVVKCGLSYFVYVSILTVRSHRLVSDTTVRTGRSQCRRMKDAFGDAWVGGVINVASSMKIREHLKAEVSFSLKEY